MAAAAEPASPAETGQDHHSSACLVELQAGRSDEVPVFLVHPPSGYLINYAPLVMSFPGSRPVYGFQSPGLFDKNKILRSVKETASYYLERLLEFYPCGPYVIGGWCFGGLVAYEMAVMMKKHDIRCALVFMIDTPALKPSDPRLMTMFLAEKLTALMRMPLRGKIQYLKTKIRDAVKGKYYDKIIPENHNIAEGPNVINRGVVWRANVNAFLSHKVTPSEQRVVLFTGTKKEYDMINTPSLGWRCSDPAVELVEIPANHDTIIDHANSKAIAEYLESLIQKI
jgi:thioesterase domain-containing protein